jgi:hypothetical protein
MKFGIDRIPETHSKFKLTCGKIDQFLIPTLNVMAWLVLVKPFRPKIWAGENLRISSYSDPPLTPTYISAWQTMQMGSTQAKSVMVGCPASDPPKEVFLQRTTEIDILVGSLAITDGRHKEGMYSNFGPRIRMQSPRRSHGDFSNRF